jgi:hypothetical protein
MTKRDPKTKGGRKQTEKDFDCIEWKRHIQAEIYQEIKNMTHEEEIAYWRRKANEGWVGKWWRSIHAGSETVHEKPPTQPDT